jgi:DNA-binding response OmpR family regulator
MVNNRSDGAWVTRAQSVPPAGVAKVREPGVLETPAHGVDEGLVVDALAHEVLLHGQLVPVTAKEFALLHYLYERRGIVFTREQLLRDVWGERYRGGPRTVDIHIRRVRIKVGAQWIETIRQVGYKFRRRGSV